jgi:putative inorganic carbon (HCO3(-)) transporter
MNRTSSVEWWRPQVASEIGPSPAVRKAGRQSSVPFWAVMAFTFDMLISPQAYFPVLAPLHIALLSAAVATGIYLWNCLMYRRAIGVSSPEMLLVAALAGWALLTAPLSYSPPDSMSALFNHYVKSLILFWLLSNVVNSITKLGQVAWGLSIMAIPLAVAGVKHFYSGVFLSGTGLQRIMGYDSALTGNPNDLALMLNLIIPLSVALLQIHRQRAVRALLLGGIGLSAIAIVLTFSRGGFVTLAALFFVYLWKFRRRPQRRWMWALAALLVLFIPLASPSYLARLATITEAETDKTGSSQQRWNDMAAAFRYTTEHPVVGAGIGQNLKAIQEERGPDGFLVHNVYLQYAVELGLPGLLLYLLLFLRCYKSATLAQRRSERVPAHRELFYLAEGIQTCLIAFAIAALFHPVAYHFHFYYMGGLALAAGTLSAPEERQWK